MYFTWKRTTWADAGIIGWLVDGAAIITQTNMLGASYGPYARALQRICAEEVFHAQHGESIIMALAEGTDDQKAMIQESIQLLVGIIANVLWTSEQRNNRFIETRFDD